MGQGAFSRSYQQVGCKMRLVLLLLLVLALPAQTLPPTHSIVYKAKQAAYNKNYSVPNPASHFTSLDPLTTYGVGIIWCGATALIIKAARHGEIPLMEAWVIVASCVVPVLGGYLVRRWAAKHLEWNKLKPPVWRYDPGRVEW